MYAMGEGDYALCKLMIRKTTGRTGQVGFMYAAGHLATTLYCIAPCLFAAVALFAASFEVLCLIREVAGQ